MKLVIIGSPGTGKTSLARQIQEIRDLPLLHLDSIFHKISDEKEAREQLKRTMLEFMRSHEEWIIDGNYGDSLELRFKEADYCGLAKVFTYDNPVSCFETLV